MTQIIEMGTISSRGQIAIPAKIRAELNLTEGEKVLFVSDGDNLLMKRVMNKKSWEEVTRPLREAAKESGFKESDVVDLIHRMRKEEREKNEGNN
jgi:antitoxin PrlF